MKQSYYTHYERVNGMISISSMKCLRNPAAITQRKIGSKLRSRLSNVVEWERAKPKVCSYHMEGKRMKPEEICKELIMSNISLLRMAQEYSSFCVDGRQIEIKEYIRLLNLFDVYRDNELIESGVDINKASEIMGITKSNLYDMAKTGRKSLEGYSLKRTKG